MKRKGHLAVFENISEESKDDNLEDDSDDMYEDEDLVKPKKHKRMPNIYKSIFMLCKYKKCKENFKDLSKFNEHLKLHIENDYDHDNYSCEFDLCNFKPINNLHALQHISYHAYYERLIKIGEELARRDKLPDCKLDNTFEYPNEIENYICQWKHCNMKINTYVDFTYHMKMHVNSYPRLDKERNIKCEWKGCTKKFVSIYLLNTHLSVHTKEKCIGCSVCHCTFSSFVRYRDHRSRQIPIEKQNYKCSQCSKYFATENILRDHVRAHINQYKCPFCDMTCPKPSNLAIHMRYRHIKERPFKCHLCEHASITKQNLEMHLITHCAEKLLACDDCDFRCRSLHTLDRHIQKVHGQKYCSTYECHLCKKRYKRGHYLTTHLLKVHQVQWPSGHSRFRYKEDQDGICRLQTIRYETVDVIKEIIKNKTTTIENNKKLKIVLKESVNDDGLITFNATVEEDQIVNKIEIKKEKNDVLLTISDLDDKGNVLSEIIEKQEIIPEEIIEDVKFI